MNGESLCRISPHYQLPGRRSRAATILGSVMLAISIQRLARKRKYGARPKAADRRIKILMMSPPRGTTSAMVCARWRVHDGVTYRWMRPKTIPALHRTLNKIRLSSLYLLSRPPSEPANSAVANNCWTFHPALLYRDVFSPVFDHISAASAYLAKIEVAKSAISAAGGETRQFTGASAAFNYAASPSLVGNAAE